MVPLSNSSAHTSHDSLHNHLTALRTHLPSKQPLPSLPSKDVHLLSSSHRSSQSIHKPKESHHNSILIVEDVILDNLPQLPHPPEDVMEMFPDDNDNELENNGMNISTFPPSYLKTNHRVHIKLPDSKSFQDGFLQDSRNKTMWNFYPGHSRKTTPILLSTDLLSTLFSSGQFRIPEGFT